MRHGLRSPRSPVGSRIDSDVGQFRRALEDGVARTHGGDIGVYHAGLIQTATEAAKAAMKLCVWLRRDWEGLSWSERFKANADIVAMLEKRDRAVEKLGIDDSAPFDPWSVEDRRA